MPALRCHEARPLVPRTPVIAEPRQQLEVPLPVGITYTITKTIQFVYQWCKGLGFGWGRPLITLPNRFLLRPLPHVYTKRNGRKDDADADPGER